MAHAEQGHNFSIKWHDLTHKVHQSKWTRFSSSYSTERIILNNICGQAKSGQLTCILGPSGAGKSTLLRCIFEQIASSKSKNKQASNVTVKGARIDKLKVSVVTQKDQFNEWLTIREDLTFVSKLKATTPFRISDEEAKRMKLYGLGKITLPIDHNQNALDAANLLGLTSCLDILIKNISGGEKKRLSLARELMSRPDVLVLDEPTTGLDSLSCNKLVLLLKELIQGSSNPLCVIMTIHQPDRSVFNMFDRAYVLSRDGSVIFDDKPSKAKLLIDDATEFLDLHGKVYNPASLLVELATCARYKEFKFMQRNKQNSVSGQHPSSYNSHMDQIHIDNSDGSYRSVGHIEPFNMDCHSLSHRTSPEISLTSSFNEKLYHIRVLTHRSWLSTIRNPTLIRARLMFYTLYPAFMMFVFSKSNLSLNACPRIESEFRLDKMKKLIADKTIQRLAIEYRNTFENIGFITLLLYGFSVNELTLSGSFYPQRINMLRKETRNGLYSPLSFLIAQTLADFPFEFAFPFMSGLLTYHLSGQANYHMDWRPFYAALVVFLFNYSNYWIGLVGGLLWPDNLTMAMLVPQSLVTSSMSLVGVVINLRRLPKMVRNISYFSHFQRALFATLSARYGFNTCNCHRADIHKKQTGILSPRVRKVVDYVTAQDNSTSTWGFKGSKIFDKLTDKYRISLTYGINVKSCADARPKLMHSFGIVDRDLFNGILFLVSMSFLLLLFSCLLLKKAINKTK